ncbi:MAG: LysR family transcriptional regulator [Kiloniellales bacterium]
MSQLNYHHLRYFRAVAHEGNLTRAARRLNLSQSALSVQIKQLEERLGHALFLRQGRQLQLTEAGRIALDHADRIFATGEQLIGSLNQAGRARQAVRIGALATLSRNFQIGFLRPLLGRSDVEVILRSGTLAELMPALQALNLDIVLVNRPPAEDAVTAFHAHRLAEQGVSLVATPERLAAPRPLEELMQDHPVILPTRDSGIRIGFDALMDRLDLSPQIAAEVDDMAMLRLLAREGVGLAVIPPIVVQDELRSGRLVALDQLPDIVETFYAVTLERKFPNPLVRSLLGTEEEQTVTR